MRDMKWPTHTKRDVFIGNTPVKETYAYGKRPTKGMALPGLQHTTYISDCIMLQRNAIHCNTLQDAATCCNMIQHTLYVWGLPLGKVLRSNDTDILTPHCNELQRTATHCKTLQNNATHCNTLQCTSTHCNPAQHNAIHCNKKHHTEV